MVCHFIKDPKSLAKLRAEFDEVRASKKGKDLATVLDDLVTLDGI
jgi:hypothetical protein